METVSVANQPWPEELSEKTLIRAAQRQDHDAFEQLVRRYDRSVLRVALHLLRSEEDARDAYQEIFLRTYRSLNSFRFQCSFHTWLYRVATNVCLDFLRRKRAHRDRWTAAETSAEGLGPLDTASDDRASSNPDSILACRDTAGRIARALELLTPKERMVFELKHFEGLRLRVIGDRLAISEEAAKNCLFRAHRKLRTALKDVPR